MTPSEILTELEKLALRLGVPVRFEVFSIPGVRRETISLGKGGLCRLRGQALIVIDAGAPVLDKIGVLSEALARFDLEAIYVPPVLRARLDARLDAKAGRTRTSKRAGPIAARTFADGPRGPVKAVRRLRAVHE